MEGGRTCYIFMLYANNDFYASLNVKYNDRVFLILRMASFQLCLAVQSWPEIANIIRSSFSQNKKFYSDEQL